MYGSVVTEQTLCSACSSTSDSAAGSSKEISWPPVDGPEQQLCFHCRRVTSKHLLASTLSDRTFEGFGYGPTLGHVFSHRSTCPLCEVVFHLLDENGHMRKNFECRTFWRLVNPLGFKCTGRGFYGPDKLLAEKRSVGHWLDFDTHFPLQIDDCYTSIDGLGIDVEDAPGSHEFPDFTECGLQVFASASATRRVRHQCWRQEYWQGTFMDRISLARSWLQDCLNDHCGICGYTLDFEKLDESTIHLPLPTRVVLVSGVNSPRIVETNGLRGRFAALSYCWGAVSASRAACLTTVNHAEYIHRLPLERLTQTILDAMTVTTELNLQYLWVDSLCILQDDQHDWAREAKRMGSVYQYATVTIAVLGARDSCSGFLADLTPQPSLRIPWTEKCDRCKKTFVSDSLIMPKASRFHPVEDGGILNSRTLAEQIRESNWSTRTWTFQEQQLSRRILYFGRDQIFWDCRAKLLSEDCSDNILGLPKIFTSNKKLYFRLQAHAVFRDPRVATSAARDLIDLYEQRLQEDRDQGRIDDENREEIEHQMRYFKKAALLSQSAVIVRPLLWLLRRASGVLTAPPLRLPWNQFLFDPTSLVPAYTLRQITFSKDKLLAFEGLARMIATRTKQKYKAGLWEDHLVRGLFWFPKEGSASYAPPLPAPSWSWASCAGGVCIGSKFPEIRGGEMKEKDKSKLPQEATRQVLFAPLIADHSAGSGCLKSVSFPKGNPNMMQQPGIEPVSLKAKAMCLAAQRSNSSCSSYATTYRQLVNDVKIWPAYFEQWPLQRCFMLYTRGQSHVKSEVPQTKHICPQCEFECSSSDEMSLIEQLESCPGSQDTHADQNESSTKLFGIACFDNEEEPPAKFEVIVLWHCRDPRIYLHDRALKTQAIEYSDTSSELRASPLDLSETSPALSEASPTLSDATPDLPEDSAEAIDALLDLPNSSPQTTDAFYYLFGSSTDTIDALPETIGVSPNILNASSDTNDASSDTNDASPDAFDALPDASDTSSKSGPTSMNDGNLNDGDASPSDTSSESLRDSSDSEVDYEHLLSLCPLRLSNFHLLGFRKWTLKETDKDFRKRSVARRYMAGVHKWSYFLLLVERTGSANTYKRVGIGMAYWIPGLHRFGGVDLSKTSRRRKVVIV